MYKSLSIELWALSDMSPELIRIWGTAGIIYSGEFKTYCIQDARSESFSLILEYLLKLKYNVFLNRLNTQKKCIYYSIDVKSDLKSDDFDRTNLIQSLNEDCRLLSVSLLDRRPTQALAIGSYSVDYDNSIFTLKLPTHDYDIRGFTIIKINRVENLLRVFYE